ncbi:short-chain dehydrogenase [Paenibacillaceae bacterium WGS1546]|uniref:short-chain dehydrogenase n=1 Tax=Cohnella sp. WGS1546 TaxID=3366810 RepID=UPI00372D709E
MNALVVGGSGMLAQTSLWLAEHGYTVSVIGRNPQKLGKLADKNQNILPISVDYNHQELLCNRLQKSILSSGPFDVIVAWIHSNEKQIIHTISSENNQHARNRWSLFHQIQLGFMIEHNRSRWLTHDEISTGVINAIKLKMKQSVVGTLTPWSMRP